MIVGVSIVQLLIAFSQVVLYGVINAAPFKARQKIIPMMMQICFYYNTIRSYVLCSVVKCLIIFSATFGIFESNTYSFDTEYRLRRCQGV
jgi:hypothetical protein